MAMRSEVTRTEQPTRGAAGGARREPPRPGTPLHAAIARRAYEIYEAAGRPEGQAVAHWLRAEAEVLAR
jgi:hypothetical protein